jgi:hypothetical protein
MEAVIAVRNDVRDELNFHTLTENISKAYADIPTSFRQTAVVCWNDACAVACRALLRKKKIAVPDDLSLVSFDDTSAASLDDITSYNFNESKVLLSMLDWVLWPSVQRGNRVVPSPAGFITQRGTVRELRSRTL